MTSTLDAPETTAPARVPLSYGKVFGQARTGTTELSKATGGLAFLLLRGSWRLLRNQATRVRDNKAAVTALAAAADSDAGVTTKSGATRKRLTIVASGAAAAVVLAGGAAVFRWSRRRTPPPPAAAPPTLTSVKPTADTETPAPASGE